MSDITVSVRCFGAFRNHGERLEVTVPAGATITDVKAALTQYLPAESALIADSVLADDHAVLAEDAAFTADTQLAILPPVCGG